MTHDVDLKAMAGVGEGDVLAGKYRIEKLLGFGGMGVVVASRDVRLDRKVAIKLLLPATLQNREAVARFANEARTAVSISSEHVARVYDVGALDSGAPYMVMEYLEGGDLARWVQQGPLPIEQAVDFVLQACVAVAEAHCLGIFHRDLKPANLFWIRRPDGQYLIKVLDFGISKLTGASASSSGSVTQTATVMGSPLYMSPEQMRSSKDADAQSDIWALGIILFELLAGRPPFQGESMTEIAVKVATEPPPPLRSFRPEVPAGLESAVVRCLQRDRRARFRHVGDLALAIGEYGSRRSRASVEQIAGIFTGAGSPMTGPASAAPIGSSGTVLASETGAPVGHTAPGAGASLPATRRAVAIAVAAFAALAIVIGAGTWAAVRRTSVAAETTSAEGSKEPRTAPRATALSAAPETVLPVAATAPHDEAAVHLVDAGDVDRPADVAAPPAAARTAALEPKATTAAPHETSRPKPAAPATTTCRVVSSFDKDGNEHFKQICN